MRSLVPKIVFIVLLLSSTAASYSVEKIEPTMPLHKAAHLDDVATLQSLLEDGAEIDALDEWGYTPLLHSLMSGGGKSSQILLDAGADVNARAMIGTIESFSPLHIAARAGDVGWVAKLLDAGAEIDATIGGGYTALHLAARAKRHEVVSFLESKGADMDAPNPDGLSARDLLIKPPPAPFSLD